MESLKPTAQIDGLGTAMKQFEELVLSVYDKFAPWRQEELLAMYKVNSKEEFWNKIKSQFEIGYDGILQKSLGPETWLKQLLEGEHHFDPNTVSPSQLQTNNLFWSSCSNLFIPQNFPVALYFRGQLEFIVCQYESDPQQKYKFLDEAAHRFFPSNFFLQSVLTMETVEFWYKLWQAEQNGILFKIDYQKLKPAFITSRELFSKPDDFLIEDNSMIDELDSEMPVNQKIEKQLEFIPWQEDRAGYQGLFRYDNIRKPQLFASFEQELHTSGLVDENYYFIQKRGNKKILATVCKEIVHRSYFNKSSKDCIRGFSQVHYREFFEYRYDVSFKQEFNNATNEDFVELFETYRWRVKL